MQTEQERGPPYHCELSNMDSLFSKTRWEWSEEHTSHEKEAGKAEGFIF